MSLGVAAAPSAAPKSSNEARARADTLHRYRTPLTGATLIVCAVAACGGLLFGYDLGVAGGVMSMPDFTAAFFPGVSEARSGSSPWCSYSDPLLQLFSSAIFLAGIIATPCAGWLSSRHGRRTSMLAAGVCFLAGVGLCAGAHVLPMLICGRVLLGCGIGLANQAAPIYLSEMAPPQLRGTLNVTFQLMTTFGLLLAQLVNLGVAPVRPWGWRLSTGLAGVPALVLTLGALLLPETPSSLAERGRLAEAEAVLRRLRGGKAGAGVEEELADIRSAAQHAAGPWAGWRQLFSRGCLPELVSGCAVAAFSQANGINAILLFTPVVFSGLQLGQHAALLSAAVIGGTLFLGTLVSMALVDRVGRRPLLLQGGCQMLAALVGVAALLGVSSRSWGAGRASLSGGAAAGLLALMAAFVAGFSWSWGPLGWLVPSEIAPLHVRSAAQAVFTLVNFTVAFASTQSYMPLLCHLTYWTYVLFAVCVIVMVAYVLLALPETSGVPIEQMGALWRSHWLWRRVLPPQHDGREP